jgi:hypothetical protein
MIVIASFGGGVQRATVRRDGRSLTEIKLRVSKANFLVVPSSTAEIWRRSGGSPGNCLAWPNIPAGLTHLHDPARLWLALSRFAVLAAIRRSSGCSVNSVIFLVFRDPSIFPDILCTARSCSPSGTPLPGFTFAHGQRHVQMCDQSGCNDSLSRWLVELWDKCNPIPRTVNATQEREPRRGGGAMPRLLNWVGIGGSSQRARRRCVIDVRQSSRWTGRIRQTQEPD